MGWFRCAISGENFPGVLLNKSRAVGFYTTRFVEADTVDEAGKKALQMLRADALLKLPEGVSYPLAAMVYLEEIEQVPRNAVPREVPGFAFFDMKPSPGPA